MVLHFQEVNNSQEANNSPKFRINLFEVLPAVTTGETAENRCLRKISQNPKKSPSPLMESFLSNVSG